MFGYCLFKKQRLLNENKLVELKTNLSADLAVAIGAATAPSANQKAVFTKQSNEKVKSCL